MTRALLFRFWRRRRVWQHVVLPVHMSHAIEETIEILSSERGAEFCDSSSNLASSSSYCFSFSSLVHLSGKPIIKKPLGLARIRPGEMQGANKHPSSTRTSPELLPKRLCSSGKEPSSAKVAAVCRRWDRDVVSGIHKTEAGSSQLCSRSYRACPSDSGEGRDGLEGFSAAGNCESLTGAAIRSQLSAIRNDRSFFRRPDTPDPRRVEKKL
jgi:hypothetical protein